MIGGATTSALHTALKIAPLYDGPVVWVKDAAQNSIIASRLLSPDTYTDYVENLAKEQKLLCENNRSRTTFSSLEEARANKASFNES